MQNSERGIRNMERAVDSGSMLVGETKAPYRFEALFISYTKVKIRVTFRVIKLFKY